jgi:hypothetical protein
VAGFVPVRPSLPAAQKVLQKADSARRAVRCAQPGVRQIGICNRSGSEIAPAIEPRELKLRRPSRMAAALSAIAVEQSEIRTPAFLENRTPAKPAGRHRAGNTGVPVCATVDSEWPRSCTRPFQDRTKLRAKRGTHDREDAALPHQCTAFGRRAATQVGRMPTRTARASID